MEQPQTIQYDVGMSRQLLAYAFSGYARRRNASDLRGLELLAITPDERVLACVNTVLDVIFSPSNISPHSREIFELTSGIADGVQHEYAALSRCYNDKGVEITAQRIRQIHNLNIGKFRQRPMKQRLESLLQQAS